MKVNMFQVRRGMDNEPLGDYHTMNQAEARKRHYDKTYPETGRCFIVPVEMDVEELTLSREVAEINRYDFVVQVKSSLPIGDRLIEGQSKLDKFMETECPYPHQRDWIGGVKCFDREAGRRNAITPTEAIEAFTHWLYYAETDFVKKAWTGNVWMGDHLQDKLKGFINRYSNGCGTGVETLVRWHQELDQTNQAILYKYIMENHLNKWR